MERLCLLRKFEPEQHTVAEWTASDYAVLKAEVERQAQACADDPGRRVPQQEDRLTATDG